VIVQVHRPRREHQQQFGHRWQHLLTRAQHQIANFFGEGGAAGLTGHNVRDAPFGEQVRDARHLRGLAHALDAFHGDETTRHVRHGPLPADF
jgi:hypothetical protein